MFSIWIENMFSIWEKYCFVIRRHLRYLFCLCKPHFNPHSYSLTNIKQCNRHKTVVIYTRISFSKKVRRANPRQPRQTVLLSHDTVAGERILKFENPTCDDEEELQNKAIR